METIRPRLAPLLIASVTVLVVIGAFAAPGGASSGETIQLDATGSPTDIVPDDSTQPVTDIEVTADEAFSDDRARVYINLRSIQEQDVDVLQAHTGDFSISSGTLIDTASYFDSDGDRILAIEIEDTDSNGNIVIEEFIIKSLDPQGASVETDLTYGIQATEQTVSDLDDPDFDAMDHESNNFTIAEGSLAFTDQSTRSTTTIEPSFTDSALVAENPQANTDSVLVATYELDGDTYISGIEELSVQQLDNNDRISVDLEDITGFRGEMSLYLFSETRFDSEEYDSGDALSDRTLNTALGSRTAITSFGLITMDDEQFDEVITDQLILDSVELDSGENHENTFVVNLHPTDEDGNPLSDEYLGSSDVIKGENSDVPIHLKNSQGEDIELKTSGEYVVTLRVTDDNSTVGDQATPGDYQLQPNADPDEGFVPGGVADSGTLTFDIDFPPPNADRVFSNISSVGGNIIASGQLIAIQSDVEGEEFKFKKDTQEGTDLIATETVEDGYVQFHTEDISPGNYSIENSDSTSDTFGIYAHNVTANLDSNTIAADNPDTRQKFSVHSDERDEYVAAVSIKNSSNSYSKAGIIESVFTGTDDWYNATGDDKYYFDDSYDLDRHILYNNRDEDSQFLIANNTIYLFDGNAEYDLDLSELPADDYAIEVDILDTEARSTEPLSILVRETEFNNEIESTYRSNHLTIPLAVTEVTDTGVVEIESDAGDVTTVDVDVSGTAATLHVNTYAAGTDADPVVTADGGSATLVDADRLSPGEYTVRTRADPDGTTPDDTATVSLVDHPPRNATLYAGANTTAKTLTTTAAVREAIDDDRLEPAERVGPNDTVVYAVTAPGLDGLVDAHTDHDRLAALPHLPALDGTPGLDPELRERDAENPLVADLAADPLAAHSHVLVAPTGIDRITSSTTPPVPTALVVLDVDDLRFADDRTPANGTTFDARLRVTDDTLDGDDLDGDDLDGDADESDGATVTVTYVDPDADESGSDPADGGQGGGGQGGGGVPPATGGGSAGGSAPSSGNASLPALPELPFRGGLAPDPTEPTLDDDAFRSGDGAAGTDDPAGGDGTTADPGDGGPSFDDGGDDLSLSDFVPDESGGPNALLEALLSGDLRAADLLDLGVAAAEETAARLLAAAESRLDAVSLDGLLDHDLPDPTAVDPDDAEPVEIIPVDAGAWGPAAADHVPLGGTLIDRVPRIAAVPAAAAAVAAIGWGILRTRRRP